MIHPDELLLLDLDGAVIRYQAAKHASLTESYTDPEDTSGPSLIYQSIVDVRVAAQAITDRWEMP